MNSLRFALMFIVAILSVAMSHARENIDRIPVPDEQALTAAKKLVADVYKKEIGEAKSNEQKRQLALKLIQVGRDSKDDVASEYACYEMARALATTVGDVEVGLLAITKTAERFAIDPLTIGVEFVKQAALNITPNDNVFFMTPNLDELTFTALTKAKRSKEAGEVCQVAAATAKKVRDPDLAKVWDDRLAVINAQEQASIPLAEALTKLDKSALDAEANEVAGKLYCFTFDDWTKGVSLLAISGSKTLQPIAEQELKATSAGERLAVADAWYGLAQQEAGVVRQRLQRHAMEHYRAAAEKLSGLPKTRAQKRVAELFASAMPDRVPLSALKPVEYRVYAPKRGPFLTAEIAGRRFPDSLWAHATSGPGTSQIVFELPCEFKYLKGMCGFNQDTAEVRSAVQFRAIGDDKPIWTQRGRVEKTRTLSPVQIELKGVRQLTLIVECFGDNHDSSSVWVSPMLQK